MSVIRVFVTYKQSITITQLFSLALVETTVSGLMQQTTQTLCLPTDIEFQLTQSFH